MTLPAPGSHFSVVGQGMAGQGVVAQGRVQQSVVAQGVVERGWPDERRDSAMTEPSPGADGPKSDPDPDPDAGPLVLTGRLWPTFAARTVVLTPGSALPYVEADWRDALIVIESGGLEVETNSGLRRRFAAGDMLWFTHLDLRALRNCGNEPAVLKAVARRQTD
jgi:hypothetical protein